MRSTESILVMIFCTFFGYNLFIEKNVKITRRIDIILFQTDLKRKTL